MQHGITYEDVTKSFQTESIMK